VEEIYEEVYEVELTYNYFFQHLRHLKLLLLHYRVLQCPCEGWRVKRIYDLFVSGGKDSVVSATVAYEEAKEQGIPARIVFINELPAFKVPPDVLPFNPLEYVREFAKWLGADLIVLEPEFDFWEGVKKWGYPMIFHNRWCYDKIKASVLTKFIEQEIREGYSQRTWVLGIRASESTRRAKIWGLGRKRYIYQFRGYWVEYYLPILDWTEEQVENFIRERGIPKNPLWSFGFSFECLCLAGTTLKKLDEIIAKAPRLAQWLAEKDREIQRHRRSCPGYPAPLLNKKIQLHEYIEHKLKQQKLTEYAK
jgi:3'-phosphoadenosine 5'-phosphosulfate sulfotransferase (PAPS reductase)/FAD synthetase